MVLASVDTLTMVLTAIGFAMVGIATAMWPLVSRLLTKLIDNQEKVAELSGAILLLSKAYSAQQAHGEKTFVAVIEDTASHRKMIRGLLQPLCAEAGLELALFSNVDDVLATLPKTRLLILDVVLDGITETQTLNRLVGLVPDGCDVMIHAAGDYRLEDFPQVVAVLKKWGDGIGGASELVTEARKALRLDRSL